MRILACVAMLPFLATCARSQERVTFCDLLRNPEKYNGKEITVRATLAIGFEWQSLYCLECYQNGKTWLDLPIDLDDEQTSRKALKKIPAAGIVNLTVTGRFLGNGTYGHLNGYRYQLTAEKVQDVVVLSRGMKDREAERKIERRYACGGSDPK